jgi:biopolymer transport protein ExbD
MRFTTARRRRAGIDMSPLIDVVFQLLLFYAVTTQFVADERLKLQLPEAATAEREAGQKQRLAEIVVNSRGDVLIDSRVVADADLERAVKSLVASAPNKTITIRGDQGADYGRIVHVLDIARAAGAKGIDLAAIKPPQGNAPPR